MRNEDGNYTHPLLATLDDIETQLYHIGQETLGEPDPQAAAELERWTPDELGVSTAEIEEAGRFAFAACALVSKALNVLTRGYHPADDSAAEEAGL